MSASHGRRVVSMAGGTLVSRATGFLRVLVLAYVLGFTPLADAFNLANTVPNMLFDLVLGGVASATFIPVFVERLASDGERRAWRSISVIITTSVLVLGVATLATVVAAPWIIHAFTAMGVRNVVGVQAQRDAAVTLLRWFAPQIFFYGLVGIATALLNVRERFSAPAWTPVVNNVVCIVVLLWFHLVDPAPTLGASATTGHLATLGLITTAGVALQFLALGPSLVRARFGRLRPRLDWTDPGLRAVSRLGAWSLGVVVANQIALFVVLAFAFGVGGHGPVSAYTYGWSFMQMPYAVVVVSVMSSLTPALAAMASAGNTKGFTTRLGVGLRQSLVVILPCTVILVFLAQPLVAVALHHGDARTHLPAATALAVLGAGLPGFTVFQLCVRGLQAQQRARDVFFLYVVENAVTVGLCVVLGHGSLAGVTASVALAYTATAVLALVVLAHYGVNLLSELFGRHVTRSAAASVVAGLALSVADAASGATTGFGLTLRLVQSLLAGALAYVAMVAWWQRRLRNVRR
jgi:putative peptidoglycan lipid II flippase